MPESSPGNSSAVTPLNSSKRVVLLAATMSSFLSPFASSSINIALPEISTTLSLDAVTLSWISTTYLLASAMFMIPFGRIADIYGRKRIFQYGIVVEVVASILCATANSGAWLITLRTLQGVGSAMIFGTGVAMLSSAYPANERGKALGINSAAVYSGLSLGPVIGGTMMEHFSWRSVFFLNALLGIIIAIAVFWKLKGDWTGARGEKLDYTGSIIYSLTLLSLIYGFSVLPGARGTGLIIVSIIGFIIFIRWEMRQQFPVININLFRHNTVFALSNLTSLMRMTFIISAAMCFIGIFTSIARGKTHS